MLAPMHIFRIEKRAGTSIEFHFDKARDACLAARLAHDAMVIARRLVLGDRVASGGPTARAFVAFIPARVQFSPVTAPSWTTRSSDRSPGSSSPHFSRQASRQECAIPNYGHRDTPALHRPPGGGGGIKRRQNGEGTCV